MTDVLWILVQIISPIFGIVYILTISEWRFSRKVTLLAASLYLTEVIVLNFFLVRSLYPSVETTFTLDFLYRVLNNLRVVAVGFIFARQNKARTMFSVLSIFVCVFVVDTIAITIRTLMGVHLPELICELLLYPFALLVLIKIRKPFSKVSLYMQNRMWWFCVVPAVLYLAFFMQVSVPVPLERAPDNIPGALMLCAITVSIYAIIFYLFRTLSVQSNFERNTFAMKIYSNALEQQNQISSYNAKMAGIFRHDLRHITQMMLACLDNGDTEGIRKLLLNIDSNMSTPWRESFVKPIAEHKLIDSTLGHYAQRTTELGIKMTIDVSPMKDVRADMTELAVVLANAFENAVNACQGRSEGKLKAIRITGRRHGKQYFIEISNTCESPVTINPDTGLPVSSRSGHGMGSQSIAFFAQKNDAELEYVQNDNWFHLRLLLQLTSE